MTVSGKMLTAAPEEVNKGDKYHKHYISKEQPSPWVARKTQGHPYLSFRRMLVVQLK